MTTSTLTDRYIWAVQRSLRARIMAAFEDAGIQGPLVRGFPPTEL